jgi:hypothetical protein
MKLLFCLVVIALSACATVTRPQAPAGTSASAAPGTMTITGDELKQTGRPDLSGALRASSPIFH